jgi:gamma-glutamyltranspeptidase/glutathione hydrolase
VAPGVTPGQLNYEGVLPTHSFGQVTRITQVNRSLFTSTATLTIALQDANDAPTIAPQAPLFISEALLLPGVGAGVSFGVVQAFDEDTTPIPGAFDAWMLMLRDHGTWKPREILEFAIGYARHGAHMVPRICQTIDTVRPLFETAWPTSAELWLRDGGPAPGGLYANPVLADTYSRIVAEAEAAGGDRIAQIEAARAAFYKGFVAEAVESFARRFAALDTTGERNHGVITAHDMANWQASYDAPLRYNYHGTEVLKCGPWSQGPAMLMTLSLLRDIDVAGMDPMGAELVHHFVEAQKLAFADREAWCGDPNFFDVPMSTLVSDDYNAARRRLIGHQRDAPFT